MKNREILGISTIFFRQLRKKIVEIICDVFRTLYKKNIFSERRNHNTHTERETPKNLMFVISFQ